MPCTYETFTLLLICSSVRLCTGQNATTATSDGASTTEIVTKPTSTYFSTIGNASAVTAHNSTSAQPTSLENTITPTLDTIDPTVTVTADMSSATWTSSISNSTASSPEYSGDASTTTSSTTGQSTAIVTVIPTSDTSSFVFDVHSFLIGIAASVCVVVLVSLYMVMRKKKMQVTKQSASQASYKITHADFVPSAVDDVPMSEV